MSDHTPLPVSGYKPQSDESIALVNENKEIEENLLRRLDLFAHRADIDGRWLAVGRTHLEQAFMAINRAIFKPTRVRLPSD